jgi:CHAD domain-containing protein
MDHCAALLVLLRQRLETLIDALPAAQSGDPHSVHAARVASRRLRAALPVLRKSLDDQAISKARTRVRRMTRALGPVRELDVALQSLEELAGRGVTSARAINHVRRVIVEERSARRRAMLDEITPRRVERLRRELAAVGSGPEARVRPEAIKDAARRVERRARELARVIEKAGSLYVPERLHLVRVAAKKLRYAMEVERELKRSRAVARIRQLKALQDCLGRLHDLHILSEKTRSARSQVPGIDKRLVDDLDALIDAIERDGRKEHAAYMRRRDSILKLCAAVFEARSDAVA